MRADELETRMRGHEYFHRLRVLPGAWTVIRVDGRSFTTLTRSGFDRPFDTRFHEAMVQSAEALLVELDGVYAYTESDEISLLMSRETALFDREVEKLVSVSAGMASATFSHALGMAAHFDSRLWIAAAWPDVVDYFRWRQADATRCGLNGWCYWTLIKSGETPASAHAMLEGASFADKNELLFQRGINFNEVPLWQRRGTGLLWEQYAKQGLDPRTSTITTTSRRRVRREESLPSGEAYRAFIDEVRRADETER